MCKYLLVESRAIFEGRRNTNPSAHPRTKKDVPKGTSYLLATRLLRRRANRVAKCGKLTQFCTRIAVALYFGLKDRFFLGVAEVDRLPLFIAVARREPVRGSLPDKFPNGPYVEIFH